MAPAAFACGGTLRCARLTGWRAAPSTCSASQAHRGREGAISVIAEPWADTGTGRLMIAVLGGLADVERDLIRTRTAEGRSRAKARGKHMGRPPSLTAVQQKEATKRRAEGATLQELADRYDRSISTMRRATRAI